MPFALHLMPNTSYGTCLPLNQGTCFGSLHEFIANLHSGGMDIKLTTYYVLPLCIISSYYYRTRVCVLAISLVCINMQNTLVYLACNYNAYSGR